MSTPFLTAIGMFGGLGNLMFAWASGLMIPPIQVRPLTGRGPHYPMHLGDEALPCAHPSSGHPQGDSRRTKIRCLNAEVNICGLQLHRLPLSHHRMSGIRSAWILCSRRCACWIQCLKRGETWVPAHQGHVDLLLSSKLVHVDVTLITYVAWNQIAVFCRSNVVH